MTSDQLVAYYRRQSPPMQNALRAFWRTLVSVPHTGRTFDAALAIIRRERK